MANAYQGLTPTAFDFWVQPVFTNDAGLLYCPGFTGETFAKWDWDFVKIGDRKTPGLCEVTPQKARDVDKKKAAGSNGARLTIHGIDPGSFEIAITIWTPEQLKALRELWLYVFPPTNQRPRGASPTAPWPPAFDVQHPALKTHAIKSAVFISGDGPKPGSIKGSRVFTIKAVEYLAPSKKNVTQSPVASKPSTRDPDVVYATPGTDPNNTGPFTFPNDVQL